MTKIVDIGAVSEGDKSTLEKTGIATAEEPAKVEAKDLPEGTMMEITQPGTDKKFTFPALALAGGDLQRWH